MSLIIQVILLPLLLLSLFRPFRSSRTACLDCTFQLNLSPFLDLNGSDVSYLLFSLTLCPSLSGACLVGAGSIVASWLGDPEWSDLGGPPFVFEELGYVAVYSRDSCICLRL